jgi:glutamate-1-semialdehyde 2,1-aminomutase
LAVAAGIVTLKKLADREVYNHLEEKTSHLAEGLKSAAQGEEVFFTRVGSMLCLFFQPGPVYDFDSATRSDTVKYAKYFSLMLQKGIYLAPSQYEAVFVSDAHTQQDVTQTIKAAQEVFASL